MPYQTIVYKELSSMGYTVHAFYKDNERQTPYIPDDVQDVNYYPESKFTKDELFDFVRVLNPSLLVVCGWASRKYMYVARKIKRIQKIPVVCPIDTQYLGTLKQRLGFLISPLYIKTAFSHIWVPGFRQYYFAKRLGYANERIIFNSLAGDVELFWSSSIEQKKTSYPKVFLFVGRYMEVKGLQMLIDVWKSIEDKRGWKIVCAGNGPLQNILEATEHVEVLNFQSQKQLVSLAEKSGAFILPSLYEPWALVLHEFAAAGLPIICSKACGASDHFVIENYNGFTFHQNSFDELKQVLLKFIESSDNDKYNMAINSRKLSMTITPKLSAKSLLSII